jgi:hypothetical protein
LVLIKTTDIYPTKTTVLFSIILGGQFEPELGGQFEMAEGGQFPVAGGGQFAWIFHLYRYSCDSCNCRGILDDRLFINLWHPTRYQ